MTDVVLLDEYIKRSGLKLGNIAERLGISVFALQQKRQNKTEFKPSEISVLAPLLGIRTPEELQRIFFAGSVDMKSTT